MPLVDLTNPDIIKFYNDMYDKTARLRMKWNTLHADKLKKAATCQHELKGYREDDIVESTMVAGLPTIARDSAVATRNRRKKPVRDGKIFGISTLKKEHTLIDVGLGKTEEDSRLARPDTDLTLDPIMRPVDPKQMSILYKNLPDYGRKVYLRNRTKLAPDQKYYFAETSGWCYGWRRDDSYFSKNAPSFGRQWRLTRDTMSRTGSQPDPYHYKHSDAPALQKCVS